MESYTLGVLKELEGGKTDIEDMNGFLHALERELEEGSGISMNREWTR